MKNLAVTLFSVSTLLVATGAFAVGPSGEGLRDNYDIQMMKRRMAPREAVVDRAITPSLLILQAPVVSDGKVIAMGTALRIQEVKKVAGEDSIEVRYGANGELSMQIPFSTTIRRDKALYDLTNGHSLNIERCAKTDVLSSRGIWNEAAQRCTESVVKLVGYECGSFTRTPIVDGNKELNVAQFNLQDEIQQTVATVVTSCRETHAMK